MIERRCDQCQGDMLMREELVSWDNVMICHRCTDKPINEDTDGICVGQSLSLNERQLKPY